jgi:hypothetical protein
MELTIEVACENLPGREFCEARGEPAVRRDVHLGIQQGEAVVGAVPGDAERVVFRPVFRVSPLPDGKTNFLGPFAKGTPGERFFYLSWVARVEDGGLAMFRRLKVHLSHLPWSRVEGAVRSGEPLAVRISMTDGRGGPLCGSIREGSGIWDRDP